MPDNFLRSTVYWKIPIKSKFNNTDAHHGYPE